MKGERGAERTMAAYTAPTKAGEKMGLGAIVARFFGRQEQAAACDACRETSTGGLVEIESRHGGSVKRICPSCAVKLLPEWEGAQLADFLDLREDHPHQEEEKRSA
jgi:hypothetical protein